MGMPGTRIGATLYVIERNALVTYVSFLTARHGGEAAEYGHSDSGRSCPRFLQWDCPYAQLLYCQLTGGRNRLLA